MDGIGVPRSRRAIAGGQDGFVSVVLQSFKFVDLRFIHGLRAEEIGCVSRLGRSTNSAGHIESAGSTRKSRDWEALVSGILQGNILPRISNSSRLRASLVSKRWLKACSTSAVTKPGTCFVKLYWKGLEGFITDEIQIHSPLQGEWYSGERVGWVGERNFECNGQALHGGQNGLVFVCR